jgi:hypothetical protein
MYQYCALSRILALKEKKQRKVPLTPTFQLLESGFYIPPNPPATKSGGKFSVQSAIRVTSELCTVLLLTIYMALSEMFPSVSGIEPRAYR